MPFDDAAPWCGRCEKRMRFVGRVAGKRDPYVWVWNCIECGELRPAPVSIERVCWCGHDFEPGSSRCPKAQGTGEDVVARRGA